MILNIPNIIIPSDTEIIQSNISNKERVFPIVINSEWSSVIYEIWMSNKEKSQIISEDVLHRIKQLDASYDWAIYTEDFSEKTIFELKSEENIIKDGIKIIKDIAINYFDFRFFEDAIQLETQYYDRILSNTSSKTKYFQFQ